MASDGTKRRAAPAKAARSPKNGALGALRETALLASAMEEAATRLSAAGAEQAAH